jgi:precorrin-4/cobalt-precorrin-4 C11-methyltransferase
VIWFVGAGPGDPELITVKGYRLLREADLVVYAGSLVNEDLLRDTKPGARIVNSAGLHLDEIVDEMIAAYGRGEQVVRLHTGDPSLYGAIGEQMDKLREQGIPYGVVPGVSSFLAAAAGLKREYTVPDGTQTLIITRLEGRTPVPERERMRDLAAHGCSMAVFLSAGMIDRVVEELQSSYPPDTPAAVVEKASWPQERIITGTLADIAGLTRAAGINKTALILVGDFLRSSGRSKLYDEEFKHGFRQ